LAQSSSKSAQMHDSQIPETRNLVCPITHALYQDPVVTLVGNTYERSAVLAFWERIGQLRDPLTNATLQSDLLITNWDKKREVEVYVSTCRAADGDTEGDTGGRKEPQCPPPLQQLPKQPQPLPQQRLLQQQQQQQRCRSEQHFVDAWIEKCEHRMFPTMIPESMQHRFSGREFAAVIHTLNEKLGQAEGGFLRNVLLAVTFCGLCVGLTLRRRPRSCIVSGCSLATFTFLLSLPDDPQVRANKQEAERYFREEFVEFFRTRQIEVVIAAGTIVAATELRFRGSVQTS